MFRICSIFYLTLIFAISARDYEYPILINPDGTIQVRPFNKGQQFTFDSIKGEINYFHTEISKIIPYLIQHGKVKNNEFTMEMRSFIETTPGRRAQLFIRENFVLKFQDKKLTSISFEISKSRINPKMESETEITSISNNILNEEMSDLKLQIDTHTNYTEFNSPKRKVFNMTELPYPATRIKLLRNYKSKVEETLRALDRIVDRSVINDNTKILNTLNEMEGE